MEIEDPNDDPPVRDSAASDTAGFASDVPEAPRRRFQYSLGRLMLVVVVVSLAASYTNWLGVDSLGQAVLTVIIGGAAAVITLIVNRRNAYQLLSAVIFVLLCFVGLVIFISVRAISH